MLRLREVGNIQECAVILLCDILASGSGSFFQISGLFPGNKGIRIARGAAPIFQGVIHDQMFPGGIDRFQVSGDIGKPAAVRQAVDSFGIGKELSVREDAGIRLVFRVIKHFAGHGVVRSSAVENDIAGPDGSAVRAGEEPFLPGDLPPDLIRAQIDHHTLIELMDEDPFPVR